MFWFAADKKGLSAGWSDRNTQEFILLTNAMVIQKKWVVASSPDVITHSHCRTWMFCLYRKMSPILICLRPRVSFWEFKEQWVSSCHRWLKNFVFHSWFHFLSSFSVQKKSWHPSAFKLVISPVTDKTCRTLSDILKKTKICDKWIHSFPGLKGKEEGMTYKGIV